MSELSFNATIYLQTTDISKKTWHFLDLPTDISAEIKELTKDVKKKGRKSVKVEVRIWFATWQTSIFPSTETKYILPVKKSVREELKIWEGSEVLVWMKVLL